MSALGQKQTFTRLQPSALPPKADIAGNNSGSRRDPSRFPPKTTDIRAVRLASSKIAEFGKYDSLVGLEIPAGVFSFDAQRMPSRKDGTRVGDEGKAAGIAQAPAALLSQHNVTIRSVITITESRSFVIPALVMIEPPSPRVVLAKLGDRCLLLGVKRTCLEDHWMSAFDPERTLLKLSLPGVGGEPAGRA